MKVKCICNKNYEEELTINRLYDIINCMKDDNDEYEKSYYEKIRKSYLIKDDNNHIFYYPKSCFKLLSEIRNEKIDKLLG
jgi:hypothetical protein